MSIDLVTGYAAASHITAEKVRLGNCGIVGTGDYVLQNGNKFAAEIVTNNKVSIADGDAMMQGAHISIAPGSVENVTIANGTAGLNRHDIICLQYSKNTTTGVETASLVVAQGTAAATATDPETTSGTLSTGDTLHQMPLYRVNISGLTITQIDTLFIVANPLAAKADTANVNMHNLSLASGWSDQWASTPATYSKDAFGRVVVSLGTVCSSTISTSSAVTIATLPSGFRPSYGVYGVGVDINSGYPVQITITSDGVIKATPLCGQSSLRTVKAMFTFDTAVLP